MPIGSGVWGIDVGQCALKAMHCVVGDDGETLEADAFDYIEYPKILSQPDADPVELVRDALKQFASRNPLRGNRVAISVAGQSGLARFIKLPPVEAKKIPDIVKFEAKQQIPFDLSDVIWDYQQIGPGGEEEGFALDTEVGLFAMKREQVFQSIDPFVNTDIELDIVQLTPLCVFNAVAHERFDDLPSADDYDPDDPPPSTVILSMGTDTTDLVISNGFRIWQRSIPLGGNHFTKQLTKDLKLTFAKAEHLKRNARQAENAKAIFQAMRPTFNDMVTEVQRSISFFQNLNREAKIGKVVALGNAAKLPGLIQYLAKNLGFEIEFLDTFAKLDASAVMDSPQFKDNVPSFAVSYGLALQAQGMSSISTSLLPREILTQRLIRRKKPWALAMAASLMFGFTFSTVFNGMSWSTVNDEEWNKAMTRVTSVVGAGKTYTEKDQEQQQTMDQLEALGEDVVGSAEGRVLMVEMWQALNAALPSNEDIPPGKIPTAEEVPFNQRAELFLEHVESEYYPDLQLWFNEEVQKRYEEGLRAFAEPEEETPAEPAAEDGEPPVDEEPAAPPGGDEATGDDAGGSGGPTGGGWVIELKGFHLHNADPQNEGSQYVRDTLLRRLESGKVMLPPRIGEPAQEVSMKDLGIGYPILVTKEPIERTFKVRNPEFIGQSSDSGTGGFGHAASDATPAAPQNVPEFFVVPRYSFVVQFVWQPTRMTKRLEKQQAEPARPSDVASTR